MSRWAGPADNDAPDGEDALALDDAPPEPSLRSLAADALRAAGFSVVRDWPLNHLDGREPMRGEVMLGDERRADGYEVCTLQWWGPSKGSASSRHRAVFESARLALEAVGLYAVRGGGLTLEVGWKGDPEGWVARMRERRAAA